MAQLPGTFNDGDILFAAPMELIRDFLENSLAYRATARGPDSCQHGRWQHGGRQY